MYKTDGGFFSMSWVALPDLGQTDGCGNTGAGRAVSEPGAIQKKVQVLWQFLVGKKCETHKLVFHITFRLSVCTIFDYLFFS